MFDPLRPMSHLEFWLWKLRLKWSLWWKRWRGL